MSKSDGPHHGSSLLSLLEFYRQGGSIRAGTRVPPVNPVIPHVRASSECGECQTWTFGDTRFEADNLMAAHKRRCHS